MKEYIVIVIACLILSYFIGFIAGGARSDVIYKTEYIKGDTIRQAITNIVPVSEEKPENPILPVKRDTVYVDSIIYVREVVDTAAIIADYELKRKYNVPLFNNEYGKLDVSLTSQYNKLSDMSYTFIPIQTVKYIQTKRVWQPFISASYSTFGVGGIGGGVFYYDVGLEYEFQYSIPENRTGHLVGLKYKF